MAGIAVGHSGAYKGPGTYKGAGPANKGIKAIGHSFAYRGPGTYAKPGAPHQASHAPNPANNPLLNPNTTLAGKSLQQAAQALTDSQTKGPLAELAAQIARNNNQGNAAEKLTSGYFNQLGNQVQSGVNQERQFGNALNSQLQNIGNQTQNYLGQLGSVNTQSMLQHAPQGEGGTNPAIQGLTAELARQQGLAAQDAGTFRLSGAAQGNNYGQMAASNLATYGLRGQERLGNIAQATRLANEPINQKVANITAQRGSLLATNEGKLRQQEITNNISKTGLGLKAQSNAITAQNDAANQKLKAATIDTTRRGQDINARLKQIDQQLKSSQLSETQRHNLQTEQTSLLRAQRTGGGGGSGGGGSGGGGRSGSGGSANQRSTISHINSARGYINTLIGHYRNMGYSPSQARVNAYHAAQTGRLYVGGKIGWKTTKAIGDPVVLNAAYNSANLSEGLTRGDILALHSRGVNVKGLLPIGPHSGF